LPARIDNGENANRITADQQGRQDQRRNVVNGPIDQLHVQARPPRGAAEKSNGQPVILERETSKQRVTGYSAAMKSSKKKERIGKRIRAVTSERRRSHRLRRCNFGRDLLIQSIPRDSRFADVAAIDAFLA